MFVCGVFLIVTGFFKGLLLKQVREASHLPNLNLTLVSENSETLVT